MWFDRREKQKRKQQSRYRFSTLFASSASARALDLSLLSDVHVEQNSTYQCTFRSHTWESECSCGLKFQKNLFLQAVFIWWLDSRPYQRNNSEQHTCNVSFRTRRDLAFRPLETECFPVFAINKPKKSSWLERWNPTVPTWFPWRYLARGVPSPQGGNREATQHYSAKWLSKKYRMAFLTSITSRRC